MVTKQEIKEWANSPVADKFRDAVMDLADRLKTEKLFQQDEPISLDQVAAQFLSAKNRILGLLDALEVLQDLTENVLIGEEQ